MVGTDSANQEQATQENASGELSQQTQPQDEGQANQEQATSQTEEWFIDEKTKGVGERPDFLPPEFKSLAEFTKKIAEDNKSLRTSLSKKDSDAPDNYKINLDPERVKALDIEDALADEFVKDFMKKAKAGNFSQKKFDDVLETYVEGVEKQIAYEKQQDEVRTKETLEKLGANAAERISKLENWAKNHLPENLQERMDYALQDAEDVELFERIMNFSIESNNIPGREVNAKGLGLTEADLAQLCEDKRFKECATFRREVEEKHKMFYGTGQK